MLTGQSSLCLLNLTSQLLDGSLVRSDVLALLLLVQLDEVLHDTVVKVLSSCGNVRLGKVEGRED